mmetsp:Transcript_19643/g.30300  ORF Transcript_19643/g.30300 Transcript_19643/m.30300 type:complete len:92 (+) Transcript_19643:4208-4483(+)
MKFEKTTNLAGNLSSLTKGGPSKMPNLNATYGVGQLGGGQAELDTMNGRYKKKSQGENMLRQSHSNNQKQPMKASSQSSRGQGNFVKNTMV